jgi:hypothetical protein
MDSRLFLIRDWVCLLRVYCSVTRWADGEEGVIRAYTPMNGPPHSPMEYRRHGEDDNDAEGPLVYHRAQLVPAAKYLRTLIECYRSLDGVPLMNAYHSDPILRRMNIGKV